MVRDSDRTDLNLIQASNKFDLPANVIWVVKHCAQVEITDSEGNFEIWGEQIDRILGSKCVLQLSNVDIWIEFMKQHIRFAEGVQDDD